MSFSLGLLVRPTPILAQNSSLSNPSATSPFFVLRAYISVVNSAPSPFWFQAPLGLHPCPSVLHPLLFSRFPYKFSPFLHPCFIRVSSVAKNICVYLLPLYLCGEFPSPPPLPSTPKSAIIPSNPKAPAECHTAMTIPLPACSSHHWFKHQLNRSK